MTSPRSRSLLSLFLAVVFLFSPLQYIRAEEEEAEDEPEIVETEAEVPAAEDPEVDKAGLEDPALSNEPDPPYASFGEDGKGSGGFVDVAGRRASVHTDLPDGTRVYLSIPSQHGWALGDLYVLEPTEPSSDKRWPRSADGKNPGGVDFTAPSARYDRLDRTVYMIFDLEGGKTFDAIQANEPFAAFFHPHSGYFNPFLCALIKGVPFEKLVRDDVAVLRPYRDQQDKLVFDLIPAISVGYDSLIVVQTAYSEGEYYPVRVDAELLKGIVNTYRSTEWTRLPPEVFHQACRLQSDLTDPPLGMIEPESMAPNSNEFAPLLRVLTTDFGPHLKHVEAALAKSKKKDGPDIDRMSFESMKEKQTELRKVTETQFEELLLSWVKGASGAPCQADEAAALAVLWKDPRSAELRKKMLASLIESIDYWGLELKSGDRILNDMVFAAILAGHDPSGIRLNDKPPYFTQKAEEPVASRVDQMLSRQSTEDDPLYARDFYAMGVAASMVNRWDESRDLTARATKKFKKELNEMLDEPITLSSMYRALVFGRLVGAHKNPYNYRQMMREYRRAEAKYWHCLKRKRIIKLRSYNLHNFAMQSEHTIVRDVSSGILNCGKRPRPPKKPKEDDKKPESEDLKRMRQGLKDFKTGPGIPGKIKKVFKPSIPTPFDYAKSKLPGPYAIPEAVFEKMLEKIIDAWEDALEKLDVDPPRADFQIYEEPRETTLPPEMSGPNGPDEDTQNFVKACLTLQYTMEAAAVTFDRLGGAREAGDKEWEEHQLIHLEALKSEIGDAIHDVADRLQDRASNLQGVSLEDPLLPADVRAYLSTITEEDYNTLSEFIDMIRPLGDTLTSCYC